ncbi:hypothetical protein [uncultured Ruminococcus sp.]|jgi:hypothetical protein|uniref:hypothetical protein n=3 Tax=uncultured Ruminococcus sp. TaxID=165186 RepID=UPI00266CE2FF|nr:hypothetical protein [uncultured Ruminococcus sp.]
MQIQYNGKSKILRRIVELVNRSQNVALRQDNTDKNTLYWTGLDGVEITVNIPSGAVKVDAELSETSTNPVENQAITKGLAQKADKSAIPTVGDGVLSVQCNGKSVGTFSANAAEDASVNIPVPEKVSELENDAGYGTYTKPAAGIPKSALASGVQASLGKADTALQKHQDISGKLDKTGDASNTTVAFSAASARENVKTGEKLSVIVGKIAKWFADLKTVAFTGSYNDLANKPTIPDGSKYLPLAGGVMTGDIDMATNLKDIVVGSHKSSTSIPTAVGGGTISVKASFETGLSARKSLIGSWLDQNSVWHSVISVRHRNGYSDGPNYGLYIRSLLDSGGNLVWNKQTGAGKWQGERVLLDSGNYTNYALGKSATASAASKLSTARKINTIAFDGTADIVIPRSTKYMNASSGTGGQTGYVKVATFTVKSQYTNMPTVVRYRNRHTMPVELIFRFKNQSRVDPELEFILQVVELTGYGYKEAYLYKSATSTWDLIIAKSEAWDSVQILDCQQADGVSVTFENTHVSTVPSTAIRATVYTRAMVTSTVAAAKTLTDSGWVAMTLGSYAASGTVQYRTYGKQITITGKVVLKSEIRTNYHALQSIANTKLDFSKIKGCSGFGRSSTGVGVYAEATRFGDDNIIDVFSIDSNIAAGATLYFTITGFID